MLHLQLSHHQLASVIEKLAMDGSWEWPQGVSIYASLEPAVDQLIVSFLKKNMTEWTS